MTTEVALPGTGQRQTSHGTGGSIPLARTMHV